MPLASRASVMVRYVFEGKRDFRQLCAAVYFRPVNSATAAVPPRASITAFVVSSTCMGESYIPLNLENQVSKTLRLELSMPSATTCPAMGRKVKANPSPGTQAERMQRLRLAMECETQTEFANKYGFGVSQWNNYENGSPVGRIAARRLVAKIDGLSVGWVEEGKTGDLSVTMARKLGEA